MSATRLDKTPSTHSATDWSGTFAHKIPEFSAGHYVSWVLKASKVSRLQLSWQNPWRAHSVSFPESRLVGLELFGLTWYYSGIKPFEFWISPVKSGILAPIHRVFWKLSEIHRYKFWISQFRFGMPSSKLSVFPELSGIFPFQFQTFPYRFIIRSPSQTGPATPPSHGLKPLVVNTRGVSAILL